MVSNVTCLADLVRNAANRDPDAVAIEYEGCQLSYGQFWHRSVRLANAMLMRGLKAGDRVALFAQNCPEFLESYVGLQIAGLVAVPANYRLTPPELSFLLDNSGAAALLIGAEYLSYLDVLRESGRRLPEVVIVYAAGAEHENAYERALARRPDRSGAQVRRS
jgi:fatty-acyl-CoA synthase